MIAWYDAKYLRFQGRKWWCDRCCNPGLLVIWSEPWSALGGGAAAHPEKSLAARWTQKVSLFQQICCDTSKGKWQIDNCLGILFSTNPFVKETRALQGNIGNKNKLFEQGPQDWIWFMAEKFLHIKGSTRGPCGPRKSRVFVTVVFVFSCIIVVAALASCSNPASRLQRVNWEDSAEEAHNNVSQLHS